MSATTTRIFSGVTSLLKMPPADDHIAGRSVLRHRRIAVSAGAGILQKVVSVSTGFISVPLVLRYLGAEQFGIWMAFMGFVTFLQFTDLGLGIGLQNHLTACDGTEDRLRPQRLISSTLAIMVLVAGLLVLAALFVIPAVPLEHIVRTATEAARAQLLPCARMFVIAFALVLPLGLVQYICNAYQRSYLTYGSIAAANLLGFAGILIGIGARLPLWWFIFVTTVAPAPVYFVVGTVILSRKPWLRAAFHAISLGELRRVIKLGLPAFGAQAGGTLMLQSPTIIIGSMLGAAAVGPFALSQQLLSVANLLLNATMAPLWPAYGEAAARHDVGWIRRTFVRSVWMSFLVVGATSIMVTLLGRTVIQFWTGRPEVVPSLSLLMACSVWAAAVAWSRACLMLLNGLGRMTAQAIYGILLPVITMALCFHFGTGIGVAGVVWITVIFGEALRGVFAGAEVFHVFSTFDRIPG
jgi:O-antigen/teichoic acid export membrane protein